MNLFQSKAIFSVLIVVMLTLAGCQNPPESTSNGPVTDETETAANDPTDTTQSEADSGPEYGGILNFAVPREPPSFDCHQENTFACIHPIAPFYSLLVRFDQWNYPEIVGDLAESWSVSEDGLTYTFELHDNVTFHDGSPLTARDVKASYDKIISPPENVVSVRKGSYLMVDSVEAPDPQTVVFTLKWPSISFLPNLASPWNFIFSADKLAQDPNWYRTNIMGSGAFEFVDYVSGSNLEGKKFNNYFMEGRPYLDGFDAIFIPAMSARVSAVRGGEALIEFRGFTPSARDDIVRTLGEEAEVQEGPWLCYLNVAINNEREPFNDARFRRALNLALDRWAASESLSKITIVKYVGGVMRPGSEYAASEDELITYEGYWRDIDASRELAKRLLAEAGIEDGFSFQFKNRGLGDPFEPIGVWLIDQWRQIGLNVEHVVEEDGPFFADRSGGNFDAIMDWECGFMDEPDLQLFKFLSFGESGSNYSRYEDPTLDALYERQSQSTSVEQRTAIIREFERYLFNEKAYTFPTLWYFRISPHWAKVGGWNQLPSHYLNQDLRDVWLKQD